jgi:hypothetical protein
MAMPLSVVREALVACAAGLYREEAAVALLVAHDVWPRRGDFLRSCVDVDDDGWTRDGTATLAAVDWDAADALARTGPASSSEAAVLHLAADLANGNVGSLLIGLDTTNLSLVLEAIAHCAGWHERGVSRLVTGNVAARPVNGGAS